MQHVLRPYATTGVALVGASIIAVTPLAVPPPNVQVRPVQLVDAWSDLLTDTTANLDNIFSNADSSDISQVFSAIFTNPLGVINALTNLDPTVTTTAGVPLTVGVELTPALEMGLAQLGEEGATLDAINGVIGQLTSDPSNALNILYEGSATILNAMLNGADNVSLLGGIIDIPAFNGLLAPEQSLTVDLNLTDLINALGLGSLNLSNLDLSSLLGQIGLGDVSLSTLLTDLGISGDKLGDLLAGLTNPITTLGGLLDKLGLDGLGLGSLSLTNVLSTLGLNTDVDLGSLSLSTVLGAFGLNSDIPLLGDSLGSLLSSSELTGITDGLNSTLSGIFNGLPTTVIDALKSAGIDVTSLLTTQDVAGDLSTTLGDLLGVKGGDTVSDLLAALGISVPNDLSLGTVLTQLGYPSSIDGLTLTQLLSGLDLNDLSITSLLDNLTLGGLVGDLGLSNVELDLTNLVGDLSNLNLGDLLSDLGLGDLATVTVDPFGGLITELVDTVPAQILAAL